MRILLVNQCFYPDVAATAQHGWDLACALRDRGHQVTAISSRSLYGESGATLAASEFVEGVQIVRVGTSMFGKRSLFGRAFDFAAFFILAALQALYLPKQDVCVCFTTPPFISLVGVALKWTRGTRCVTWLMDLYPDVPVTLGLLHRNAVTCRVLDRFSLWLMSQSDAVVVLGRCMAERVIAKGLPAEAIVRIPPWSSDSPPTQTTHQMRGTNPYRVKWECGSRTLFMYSGNFGLGHDFETIGAAIKEIAPEGHVQFALVGGGRRKDALVCALSDEISNGRVVVEPYQPRERLPELLGSADVHLVSLASGCEGTMVPSKFYGILAAGCPVIYVGESTGEVARVIAETGCGLTVKPGDRDGLVKAFCSLRDDAGMRISLGKRALEASEGPYSRKAALGQWVDLLEKLEDRSTYQSV